MLFAARIAAIRRPPTAAARLASAIHPLLRTLSAPTGDGTARDAIQKEDGTGVGGVVVDEDDEDDDDDDPLRTIRAASDALSSFSSRLRDLSSEIRKPISLPSGQVVTLKDIVLHSRDADSEAFGAPAAISARATVLPIAEKVEEEMRSMAEEYVGAVASSMSRATVICRDAPCGGASWELEEEAAAASTEGGGDGDGGGGTRRMRRMDTPCGRLYRSSVRFVDLTHGTREDVTLGSRAACLLRMAEEHRAPLATVRKTEGGREAMGRAFAEGRVPTPWVRSEDEYKEHFRIRDETMMDEEAEE